MEQDREGELMQVPLARIRESREINPAAANEKPPEGKVASERAGATLPCIAPLFD
jgi:hypothetical protein